MEAQNLDNLVAPYYLAMMQLNASNVPPKLLYEVVSAGELLATRDVIQLLDVEWRRCVMGAWFSLLTDDAEVNKAVLEALRKSHGAFTLPPLAVAAVTLTEESAASPLQQYQIHDVEFDYGACGFAGAALEHLNIDSDCCEIRDSDRRDFRELMQVAKLLRSLRSQ